MRKMEKELFCDTLIPDTKWVSQIELTTDFWIFAETKFYDTEIYRRLEKLPLAKLMKYFCPDYFDTYLYSPRHFGPKTFRAYMENFGKKKYIDIASFSPGTKNVEFIHSHGDRSFVVIENFDPAKFGFEQRGNKWIYMPEYIM